MFQGLGPIGIMKSRLSHKMLPYVSQQTLPRLWYIFQLLLGGTFDKRRLVIQCHHTESRILEIGCSSGNVSAAFKKLSGIEFLGIDIDESAIDLANKIHSKHKHLKFELRSLENLTTTRRQFDYILFGGILHHVSDSEALDLIRLAKSILSKTGKIVIYEPLIPIKNDRLLVRLFYSAFEQGCYVRTKKGYENLVDGFSDLELIQCKELFLTAFLFSWPKIARIVLLVYQSSRLR